MKNMLNKFLKPKLEIPVPAQYPDFDNVVEWMDAKVEYYAKKNPNGMHVLFDPSRADYLPLTITSATSNEIFRENIEHYRQIKAKYPEAVALAKKNYTKMSYFPGGDREDYPE